MSFQTIIPSSGNMNTKEYAKNPGAGHGVVDEAQVSGKLKAVKPFALTGDVTGSTSSDLSGGVTVASTLADSGVTPGTYTKATVDGKGRVINGGMLAEADIPSLTLAKISDAGTAAALNAGSGAGNVPVLDATGKLPGSMISGGSGGPGGNGGPGSELDRVHVTQSPGDWTLAHNMQLWEADVVNDNILEDGTDVKIILDLSTILNAVTIVGTGVAEDGKAIIYAIDQPNNDVGFTMIITANA